MNSIKVCEYSRSRSFHDDLILQDQASGERSQDQWSSGFSFKVSINHSTVLFCANIIKLFYPITYSNKRANGPTAHLRNLLIVA